ncbi:erythromycin esterase family protein [Streptomyces noursei]|nr:erythromycin esterase family protein [Streptomyces noursei]
MTHETTVPRPALPSPAGPHDPAPDDIAPLTDAVLDDLAASLADATIVGLGESTRFSRETFDARDRLFRRLVRHHGFRALALQDTVAVADRLDRYVGTGQGSAAAALDDAWRPWRTAEMVAALEWIRAFNQEHPHDPVRIFGVRPAQALPQDYDVVLAHVRASAPELLSELTSHLEPIRTAHHTDEHVQRARGTHPGRPFADHARDALALIRSLPGAHRDEDVAARMRRIVDFHERSVAGRGSYAGDAAAGPTSSATSSAGPACAPSTGTASGTPRPPRAPWAWLPRRAAAERRQPAACAVRRAVRVRRDRFPPRRPRRRRRPGAGRRPARRAARRGGPARPPAGPAPRRRAPPLGRTGEAARHQRRLRPVPGRRRTPRGGIPRRRLRRSRPHPPGVPGAVVVVGPVVTFPSSPGGRPRGRREFDDRAQAAAGPRATPATTLRPLPNGNSEYLDQGDRCACRSGPRACRPAAQRVFSWPVQSSMTLARPIRGTPDER